MNVHSRAHLEPPLGEFNEFTLTPAKVKSAKQRKLAGLHRLKSVAAGCPVTSLTLLASEVRYLSIFTRAMFDNHIAGEIERGEWN